MSPLQVADGTDKGDQVVSEERLPACDVQLPQIA